MPLGVAPSHATGGGEALSSVATREDISRLAEGQRVMEARFNSRMNEMADALLHMETLLTRVVEGAGNTAGNTPKPRVRVTTPASARLNGGGESARAHAPAMAPAAAPAASRAGWDA